MFPLSPLGTNKRTCTAVERRYGHANFAPLKLQVNYSTSFLTVDQKSYIWPTDQFTQNVH